jgi:hypothetical protein
MLAREFDSAPSPAARDWTRTCRRGCPPLVNVHFAESWRRRQHLDLDRGVAEAAPTFAPPVSGQRGSRLRTRTPSARSHYRMDGGWSFRPRCCRRGRTRPRRRYIPKYILSPVHLGCSAAHTCTCAPVHVRLGNWGPGRRAAELLNPGRRQSPQLHLVAALDPARFVGRDVFTGTK